MKWIILDTMVLFRIDSLYFCAGGEIIGEKVSLAAPIIKYMVGWSQDRLIDYCHKKKWEISLIPV